MNNQSLVLLNLGNGTFKLARLIPVDENFNSVVPQNKTQHQFNFQKATETPLQTLQKLIETLKSSASACANKGKNTQLNTKFVA